MEKAFRKEYLDPRQMNKRKRWTAQEKLDLEESLVTVPDYIKKDGLRYVDKYSHAFRAFVKNRWVGRKLIDVFAEEFIHYDRAYYVQAIKDKKLMVNHSPTEEDYIIKLPDQVAHYIDRIETPVIDAPIEIVEDGDDYLVVNKPSSMPCHP